MTAVPPALTALADRVLAANDDAERRWPHNRRLINDARTESVLLDALVGPSPAEAWQDVEPGQVTVLWPSTGALVPAPPGVDLASSARRAVPRAARCDRCGHDGEVFGALLIEAGAKVIALVMCGACALDLGHLDPYWTTREKS